MQKVFSITLLLILLSVLFLSLFTMSHEMNMSMGDGGGCIFMAKEASFCPMSFMDHIGAWESTFLSVIPQLLMLLLATATVLAVIDTAPNLLKRRFLYYLPPPLHTLRERTYTYTHRQLQDFFSNGILHPKLF